jgi:outer membrane protein assembly factor BamB
MIVTSALLALLPATARADDWPQFQGPRRDATSSEIGLLRSFPEGGPPVLWTTALGEGFGGAAVQGGEVYVLDRDGEDGDALRCFDLESGEELWTAAYPCRGRLDYSGSRSVPAIVGRRVFTIGGFGHVSCFDRDARELVWQVSIAERYEADPPRWGWAQNPLVVGDRVIVAILSDEIGLAAFDAADGSEAWRTGPLGTSHSTPALVEVGGAAQVVFVSTLADGAGGVSSFDPRTGERLWRSGAYDNRIPIPPPVQIDSERLFVTGGYKAGSCMLQVTSDGDSFAVRELFEIPRGSQVHLPIRIGEHLYFLANENENDSARRHGDGGLACIDLAGKELWRTGSSPYLGRGGMIAADGMLIVQDGYVGTIYLVEPDPEGFRELDRWDAFGARSEYRDERMWAPLALSNGRLLVRNQEEMKCVDLRAK